MLTRQSLESNKDWKKQNSLRYTFTEEEFCRYAALIQTKSAFDIIISIREVSRTSWKSSAMMKADDKGADQLRSTLKISNQSIN